MSAAAAEVMAKADAEAAAAQAEIAEIMRRRKENPQGAEENPAATPRVSATCDWLNKTEWVEHADGGLMRSPIKAK